VDMHRSEYFMRAMRGVPSRRDVLRSLAGAGLGVGIVRFPDLAAAKKRKRKKRKKNKKVKPAQPNEFGCFEVGDPCRSEADCCSGICEEKNGKRTCRAHGTDVCRQDEPGVCTAPADDIPSLGCGINCFCYRTTAGSNFCGPSPRTSEQQDCTDCRTDADCVALGYPAGSACAPVGRGNCTGFCDSGMACLVPCGVEFPDPVG
jgi:hypothetical protein